MTQSAYTAFIFCRGGSKGIPDKNIRVVAGKPLLTRAIEGALSVDRIGKVIVSTDSERIAQTARDAGAQVLMRPDELATDTASELLAWRHAIAQTRDGLGDVFISLPATSPLRATQDIDAAIDVYEAGGCDIVFGISPSHRSPFLNMVRRDDTGLISLVNPGTGAVRRQDVPQVFDVTTCVYVGGTDYIDTCAGLMSGRVGSVIIPPERALDIDTPFDLHLAELLLSRPFGDT